MELTIYDIGIKEIIPCLKELEETDALSLCTLIEDLLEGQWIPYKYEEKNGEIIFAYCMDEEITIEFCRTWIEVFENVIPACGIQAYEVAELIYIDYNVEIEKYLELEGK